MTNGLQSCSLSIITCWSKWHYEDLRQLLENELWIRVRRRHCSMSPPPCQYLASFVMWCHQCLWQPIHRQVSCTSHFKSALWHMKCMECQGMSFQCSQVPKYMLVLGRRQADWLLNMFLQSRVSAAFMWIRPQRLRVRWRRAPKLPIPLSQQRPLRWNWAEVSGGTLASSCLTLTGLEFPSSPPSRKHCNREQSEVREERASGFWAWNNIDSHFLIHHQ